MSPEGLVAALGLFRRGFEERARCAFELPPRAETRRIGDTRDAGSVVFSF